MSKHSETGRRRAALALAVAGLPFALPAQEVVEEVVVTATPGNQSTNDLAQSVTVLSGEALDRARATNLGETLEGQLGVSASYFGTGSSRPIIRGLAGARVRTMEDGIESMDVSTVSVDHAVSIDPLVARQVEIFRGPTTLLYGSGAVGGVVNTVTNRIPERAPEDGFDAALEARGDTAADERTIAFALDGGGDAFAWHFDAADRDTDDYEIPGFAEHEQQEGPIPGLLENSDLELASYSLGGSWLGEGSFFGLAVSGFDTQYGVPGHAHGHEEEPIPPEPEPGHAEAVRIDLEQTRVDLKGGWTGLGGGIESINLRFGVNDYEHVELEGQELGTRFENDAWEGRLELLHAPLGRWSGAFGVQLSEREFSAVGAEAFVPPVDTTAYGVFLMERLQTDIWDFSLGARYEAEEHDPIGAARVDDTALSFSAAAIRNLGDGYSLALNFASAERMPVAEELFANGPHLASGAFEVGDPGLGSETSQHLDVGIRKTGGSLGWSITVFVTDYADFIFLRETGNILDELPELAFAQQDARFHGLEAELLAPVAEIGPGELDLTVFADFVEGELDNGDKVPRIPPLRYGARLEYHTSRLVVGLQATEYDDQRDTAPFEEPTAGYTLVGADFDWALRADGDRNLSVFVRGSNLLDEDARRHTSLVKEIAPLPGRNYAVGLRARF